MSPEIVLYVLGGVTALVSGVVGGWKIKKSGEATGELDPSREAWKVIGVLIARQEGFEQRISTLEVDLDTEREHSSKQDTAISKLEHQLAQAVQHIWEFWRWIDSGAVPPPPPRPPWLSRLPGWPHNEDGE